MVQMPAVRVTTRTGGKGETERQATSDEASKGDKGNGAQICRGAAPPDAGEASEAASG